MENRLFLEKSWNLDFSTSFMEKSWNVLKSSWKAEKYSGRVSFMVWDCGIPEIDPKF